MEGEFLGIWLCLELAQDPMHIFGYARLRGQLMLLDIVFMLFLLGYCTPMNTCLVRQHIQCHVVLIGLLYSYEHMLSQTTYTMCQHIPRSSWCLPWYKTCFKYSYPPHSEVPLGNKHKSFRPCPHPFLYFSGT